MAALGCPLAVNSPPAAQAASCNLKTKNTVPKNALGLLHGPGLRGALPWHGPHPFLGCSKEGLNTSTGTAAPPPARLLASTSIVFSLNPRFLILYPQLDRSCGSFIIIIKKWL